MSAHVRRINRQDRIATGVLVGIGGSLTAIRKFLRV